MVARLKEIFTLLLQCFFGILNGASLEFYKVFTFESIITSIPGRLSLVFFL